MSERNADFHEALKEAQRLGYAEADPSADIDGHDAAEKLSILASLAFSTRVAARDVSVEGMRAVSSDDIRAAIERGYAVKLLAIADRLSGEHGY
jgi:homoserine dehydrogenase